MTKEDIKRLGWILELQAEIEAMKVANVERAMRGESPAYGEEAFMKKRNEFHNIIYCPDEHM